MADFFDVIRARRSVRSFRSTDISDGDLDVVLGTMRRAPSAGDLAAYKVVVVRSQERRRRLARAAYDQAFVGEAPVVLAFFMDAARSRAKYGERGARLYACQDATIAAAHAQLAAHALGLATVWVGAFDDEAVSRAVDAPPSMRPSSLLVLGYPAEVPERTPRRSLHELMREETFARSSVGSRACSAARGALRDRGDVRPDRRVGGLVRAREFVSTSSTSGALERG